MSGRLLMGSTIDRTIVWKNHASGGIQPRHWGTAKWNEDRIRRRRPRRLRTLLLAAIDVAAQARRAELHRAARRGIARCAAGLARRHRSAIAGIVRCRAAVLRILLRAAALGRRHLHVLRLRDGAHREDACGRCGQ